MINNIDLLENKLAEKLPGKFAQDKMAPNFRFTGENYPDPKQAVPSGVLLLLFPNNNEWTTIFIERTGFGPHAGQISLPGGKMEESDKNNISTALREAKEEIGINSEKVRVLGRLTPLFVPHSNFCINPVVGFMNEEPDLINEPKEVKSIIKIRIKELFDKKNRGIKSFGKSGYNINAPYYNAKGHVLWGATAMIMSEFEALICGNA